MQIAKVIFIGSVAAVLAAAPALAKHPEAQKTDENQSAASSCHAYRQAADGSWQQLPCQEFGSGQTQPKQLSKGGADEPR